MENSQNFTHHARTFLVFSVILIWSLNMWNGTIRTYLITTNMLFACAWQFFAITNPMFLRFKFWWKRAIRSSFHDSSIISSFPFIFKHSFHFTHNLHFHFNFNCHASVSFWCKTQLLLILSCFAACVFLKVSFYFKRILSLAVSLDKKCN